MHRSLGQLPSTDLGRLRRSLPDQWHGDPVVLYDHIANRWLISQFAGGGVPTDECIAISTTSDATGTYNRYAFHLGTNFFDYPHLGVWPDGYYMSMNVFNSAGTAFLVRRPLPLTERKCSPAYPPLLSPRESREGVGLPSCPATSTVPISRLPAPAIPLSRSRAAAPTRFDFSTPISSRPITRTFNLIGSPPAAGFTALCPEPEPVCRSWDRQSALDGIGDRLMFRLAYRKFADGHEAVVGNYTVSANGVAGVRWFELRDVTTAPTVFQESTYQPDTTWRWMGSAAMDFAGNLAVGFSASDATINPQIRYAGRLVTDPVNTLAQGEAHLFDGTGSQSGNGNRWGDYSAMTVDPVDDCTFWYTQEYYATNGGCLEDPHRELQVPGVRLYSARGDHHGQLKPDHRKLHTS